VRGTKDKEPAMAEALKNSIAVVGIDIGKNSFHVVGLDKSGAIVLRQKWSRGQAEARFANMPPCLKRGNRYLRVLFVQAAWVVLIKPKSWERHGLKSWIEAARKRLHHNVLAIALANKLARIAWSVLAHGRSFEASKLAAAVTQPA
jgi:transposase